MKPLHQIFLSLVIGALAGAVAGAAVTSVFISDTFTSSSLFSRQKTGIDSSAIVSVVEGASPAVVSIIATQPASTVSGGGYGYEDDFWRQFFGYEPLPQSPGTEREIGSGSGFIVDSEGLIVTNKHVVPYEGVNYTVITNSGEQYSAEVLARDPVNDLAVLKIDATALPTLPLGDSDQVKVGQQIVAIGNALGEFSNSVSSGIISGLSRSVVAATQAGAEQLSNVIQTDASINHGNSGGPLLNLDGEVIGINTAIVIGAENIGFALPINEVKRAIADVEEHGEIIRPWLGVRYTMITPAFAELNQLSYDYGALVVRGVSPGAVAVVPGSPADRAGITENTIILEINGERLTERNPLHEVLNQFRPGDEIKLKIVQQGEEKSSTVRLDRYQQ